METPNPGTGGEGKATTQDVTTTTTDTNAEAVKAANARCAAIVNCEEAAGREDLAKHLAFETSMSVEDAQKMLAKAPKAAKAESPFTTAMNNSEHPNVGATDGGDGGDGNGNSTNVAVGKRIAQSYSGVTGGQYQRKD